MPARSWAGACKCTAFARMTPHLCFGLLCANAAAAAAAALRVLAALRALPAVVPLGQPPAVLQPPLLIVHDETSALLAGSIGAAADCLLPSTPLQAPALLRMLPAERAACCAVLCRAAVHWVLQGPAQLAAHAVRPPPGQDPLLQVGLRVGVVAGLAGRAQRVRSPAEHLQEPFWVIRDVAAGGSNVIHSSGTEQCHSSRVHFNPCRALHLPKLDQTEMVEIRSNWFEQSGGPPPGNKREWRRGYWGGGGVLCVDTRSNWFEQSRAAGRRAATSVSGAGRRWGWRVNWRVGSVGAAGRRPATSVSGAAASLELNAWHKPVQSSTASSSHLIHL